MSKNNLPLHADDLRAMGEDVIELISQLPPKKAEELRYHWEFWARPEQVAPKGDWNNWLINAGRGFGKTRSGVEWVRSLVKKGYKRIAAVASTNSDIERVMVKGESGFLNVCWKGDKTNRGVELGYPEWSPTKRTLTWKNGAQVQFFSAEEPERLRGPQFEAAWCFTDGTQVTTNFGDKSVEDVRVGDTVLTSKGYEKVTHTMSRPMPVGRVEFSDGTYLEGTYEHPIYTNRGWVKLGELLEEDVVWKLTTKGSDTTSDRMVTSQTGQKGCTGSSQEMSSETLTGSTFTTSTVTSATTTLTISKNSQGQTTLSYTTENGEPLERNLLEQDPFLATVAEQSLYASKNLTKGFTASPASIAALKNDEKSLETVNNVVHSLNPEWGCSVVNVVSTWQQTGVKPVHNIRVENTHEYYANGILTHNCDELCAWNKDRDTWDMLQFCLRLGKHPQTCITTTPKPTKLIREILKNPKTVVTSGSTYDNAANLAGTYLDAVKAQYEGTRLGRQELYAEILDEASGALWNRAILEKCEMDITDPVDFAQKLARVVVSIDPAVTANAESDMTGIIVAGIDHNGKCYVLEDATDRYTPEGWATTATQLYHKYAADRIVAERNQGGEMVRHTIQTVDETAPIRLVHASRGKYARAEPVSALYERGLVFHRRGLDQLETQMVSWEPLGSIGSPDRLDALVWAITDLALKGVAKPTLNIAYASSKGLLTSTH